MGREDAVLRAQRDQVGDGTEGGQIEIVLHRDRSTAFVAGETQDLQHAVDQLEDQSGGTQRLPRGVRGVVDARVDEDASDAGFLGDVVVDHDDVDAFGAEAFDLGLGIGTAVERDEELRFRLGEYTFERGHRETVALFQATRDEILRRGAESAEEVDEHRGARDPVDVVVAEDGDALALGGGDDETLGGFAQAADRERIGDVGELRAEMTLRLGLVREGTGEDGGQGFANPQRSRDATGKPGVRGPVRPGGHRSGAP